MKKHLQFVLGALMCLSLSSADAQWSLKRSGTTNGIQAMKFTDSRNGFACGEFNTILKTSNGGASWQALGTGSIPNASFLSLDALDSNHVFVARNGLYVTEDGGGSWNKWGDFASSAYSIQSIKAINDSTAFITKGGNILKTTDKGKSWTNCYFFPELTGPMIFTGNNDTAYACSGRTWDNVSYGTIHRSVDGGKTWMDLELGALQITALSFRDSRHGYYATFDNAIYGTIDGGASWAYLGRIAASGEDYISGILFTGDSNGYAISMSGKVYITGEAGATWTTNYTVPRTQTGSFVSLSAITTCGEHILIAGNEGFIIKNDGVLEIPREGWPQFRMFPNPVQQTLTIDLPDSNQYQSLRVYGINGLLVHSENVSGKLRLTLETQAYASGHYTIELVGAGGAARHMMTKN